MTRTCDILYNIDEAELSRALTHRKIVTMQESFNKPMSVFEAENARDALAKHMYACLFLHVVSKLNRNLSQSTSSSSSSSSSSTNQKAGLAPPSPTGRFIGVLDIYGFETFDSNNFEQFCINYANEKLQQQFNQHVFKLEQEEYLQEGIEWKFIDFYDNQPCIDLIESKLGILDLLDEECKMPKGSDTSWAEKLYTKCAVKWNKHFVKPRFGTVSFLIKHFADDVTYDTGGFLEKNRDTVYEEQIGLLHSSNSSQTKASSGSKILRSVFAPPDQLSPPGGTEKGGGNQYATVGHAGGQKRVAVMNAAANKMATLPSSFSKQHKKTVGSQFRESLSLLMRTLNSTIPHYIRCIKPNDTKRSFEFNAHRTMQQLRACGVLETIRISAAGFPSRWTYGEFYNRYRVLCGNLKQYNTAVHSMNEIGEHIVMSSIQDCDKYKFGKTKIFFRSGQVAYLEKLRAEKLKRCCIVIQKNVRAFLVRRKYRAIQHSVATLQRWARGCLARRLASHLRRTRAAVRIQSVVRGWTKRQAYLRLRAIVIGIQCAARGTLVRRACRVERETRAVTVIQASVRGWLARRHYARERRKVIVCQATIRRFIAKKRFKKMKKEARSVEHVKKLNKGLENKIISMQQRIGELTKESTLLKSQCADHAELKSKYETLRGVDTQFKKLQKTLATKETELLNLKQNLEIERLEKLDLINERELERSELKATNEKLERENAILVEKIQIIAEEMETSKVNIENSIRTRIEAEKNILIREQDDARDAYQRLLAEKNSLADRLESLERQQGARSGLGSSLSASNVSPTNMSPSHARTLSSTSTISVNEPKSLQDVDINLVLKLNQKLKQLELEREKLTKFVQEQTVTPSGRSMLRTKEAIKMAEVESENLRYRKDISILRSEILNQNQNLQMEKFVSQLENLEAELARLRAENAELRNLVMRENKMNYVTEDEQLLLAFETHKNIIRQLESEVDELKTRLMNDREKYLSEIQGLQDKNIKLSECLSKTYSTEVTHHTQESLSSTSLDSITPDHYLKIEILKLIEDNLKLKQMLESASFASCKEDAEVTRMIMEGGSGPPSMDDESILLGPNDSLIMSSSKLSVSASNTCNVTRKKERTYQGMFEFEKSDINMIMKRLITDLKPRIAVNLLPGLPAYVFFMCVRHTDHINDEEKVRAFLSAIILNVKRTVKKRYEDLESTILWLTNTLRLLNLLKQYSGEKPFQTENTEVQNSQCLANFDFREYRQVLSDTGVWIYQAVVRFMEEKINTIVIPAILEYESIPVMSTGKPSRTGRSESVGASPSDLQALLLGFYKNLVLHGIDMEVINQVFKQLYYYICASSLNNLLLRKELCHWTRGMQMRYNLSHLEQFTRDNKMADGEINEQLSPLIQASQLLQARKSEEDVNTVYEMCNKMSTNQIIKLLNLYTPADDYEERISQSFIHMIQEKLKERPQSEQSTLLMDTKFNFSVRFPFSASNIQLEHIEMPDVLQGPMLKKI
uniref:Unconventional myosin-Va n=3 Tax=Cacopsylla melanoneura TaxID=428564 RepID=A0A8D8YUP2_9HEMI